MSLGKALTFRSFYPVCCLIWVLHFLPNVANFADGRKCHMDKFMFGKEERHSAMGESWSLVNFAGVTLPKHRLH